MRTFTFSDARSHKFWNIDVQGSGFTVTYGRIGAAGRTLTKAFQDEAQARKEADKLIAEKLGKGYKETTPSASPAPASLREALEAALVADPDDLASHMAYADYLQEQGDPLGEFIRVQLSLEDEHTPAAQREKLQEQEAALLRKHRKAWLGELYPWLVGTKGKNATYAWRSLKSRFSFARGWLDSLEVEYYGVAFMRALAKAPQTRLLRRLALADQAYDEPDAYEPGPDVPADADRPELYPLLRSPHLGNVCVFQLGETAAARGEGGVSGERSCHTSGEAAVGLVKLMPKLEELYLLAHRVDAGQLFGLKTLHHLRILQLYHNDSYPLATLAKNPSLGKLTHLLLHPHAAEEEGSYLKLPAIKALVHSSHLPSLTYLRLPMSDMGDKGVQEIISSGVLRRLKALDLRHGRVTDEGAKALAACPDFKNLDLLDLTNNCLTGAGVKVLKATGVRLAAGDQWQPTGDGYEDTEYLYEGDIE